MAETICLCVGVDASLVILRLRGVGAAPSGSPLAARALTGAVRSPPKGLCRLLGLLAAVAVERRRGATRKQRRSTDLTADDAADAKMDGRPVRPPVLDAL